MPAYCKEVCQSIKVHRKKVKNVFLILLFQAFPIYTYTNTFTNTHMSTPKPPLPPPRAIHTYKTGSQYKFIIFYSLTYHRHISMLISKLPLSFLESGFYSVCMSQVISPILFCITDLLILDHVCSNLSFVCVLLLFGQFG